MKKNLGLILFAAVILLILFLVSSGKKPPLIPSDEFHKTITNDAACLECHAPGRRAPLKPSHPPKEQCLICHKIKKSAANEQK